MSDDDPAQASIRAVESAVELARAEVRLAVSEARETAKRLAVTIALSAAALFFLAVAFVLAVLFPVLWAFRPNAALVSALIALVFALPTVVVAALRWRSPRTPGPEESRRAPLTPNAGGPKHAVQ
jgi:uncharacterized membrane protein YqjE